MGQDIGFGLVFVHHPGAGKPPPGLSRRWWRLWLVIHSPFGIRPLSWEWWFSAGRSAPVLHQWVATLRSRVLLSFFDRLGSSNYITIDDSLEGFDRFTIEVMFYAPWVKLHLDSLSTKLVAIILGKDPLYYLVCPSDVPVSLRRIKPRRSYRFGVIFKWYDWMGSVIKHPPLCLDA